MRMTIALGWLLALGALALAPNIALAQEHPGFRIGIAQTPFAAPAMQAPATVTRSTFVGVPGRMPPAQPIQPDLPFQFPTPTVMIPNQVLIPNQPVIIPNQVIVPSQILVSGQTIVPAETVRALPLPGTPCSEVIHRFGQPSVTVITSSGEVFYFTGGVTVLIQNGQVIGAR